MKWSNRSLGESSSSGGISGIGREIGPNLKTVVQYRQGWYETERRQPKQIPSFTRLDLGIPQASHLFVQPRHAEE